MFMHPDLVLLDLGLPDIDGLDVIRELRQASNTPIVVLSVRGAERDKVAALDLGADDYLTKPFGVDELLARVRVALRHAARPETGAAAIFRAGDLHVDFEHRGVTVGGKEVHLTPTEYELLKLFVSNPNKLLTEQMLLRQVWGPQVRVRGTLSARLRGSAAEESRSRLAEPAVPGYRAGRGVSVYR